VLFGSWWPLERLSVKNGRLHVQRPGRTPRELPLDEVRDARIVGIRSRYLVVWAGAKRFALPLWSPEFKSVFALLQAERGIGVDSDRRDLYGMWRAFLPLVAVIPVPPLLAYRYGDSEPVVALGSGLAALLGVLVGACWHLASPPRRQATTGYQMAILVLLLLLCALPIVASFWID